MFATFSLPHLCMVVCIAECRGCCLSKNTTPSQLDQNSKPRNNVHMQLMLLLILQGSSSKTHLTQDQPVRSDVWIIQNIM